MHMILFRNKQVHMIL